MPRTQTKYVSLKLVGSRPDASIVVRLMMACNDLILANQCQGRYKGELRPTEKHLAQGAGMYFVRLQMAHLTEAMKILEQLKSASSFKTTISSCHSTARDAYKRLQAFLKPGPEKTWFNENIAVARNNLAFHYHESGKWIDWALTDRASRPDGDRSSITRADAGHLWRFHIADDILDSIMCRKIWKIARSADVRQEADLIADKAYSIFCDYIDFSAEYIWRYFK
jgi:hypothetical protein